MTSNRTTIVIIGGTGKEGTGLALRWAEAGYDIVIGSREISKARQTAEMIKLRLNGSVMGLTSSGGCKNGRNMLY